LDRRSRGKAPHLTSPRQAGRGIALAVLLLAAPAFAGAPAARDKVEALRSRLVKMGADQASGEDRAAAAQAKLAALNAQDSALSGRIAANRAQLTRLLSALQLMSRDPPPPLLVSPRRANDAVRAAILMRRVAPMLQQRAKALAAQAREIDRVRRQITEQNESLILTESELADRRAAIQKLAQEKGALEESLDPAARDEALKAQAAAQGARDPGALVDRLQADGAPVSGPVSGPASGAPAAVGDGRLAAPVAGVVVHRWGQLLPDRHRSEGVAWRTQPLAEVRAPVAAKVDYAGPLRGWGQVVVLRVDDHVRLVLTGLDRCDTSAGRSVAAGEPIGLMGRVRNPAPEVYLEVRRDGAPVDPMRWLDGRPGA
jgi:septal ring factor EnvC (AmiA/AmiB activator)